MRFDEATDALVEEADRRYRTDAEFHALVETAVQALYDHLYFRSASEDLKIFMRRLMIKSTSLGLVLQEHTNND